MELFFSRSWNAKIALREHEHFKTVNIYCYYTIIKIMLLQYRLENKTNRQVMYIIIGCQYMDNKFTTRLFPTKKKIKIKSNEVKVKVGSHFQTTHRKNNKAI